MLGLPGAPGAAGAVLLAAVSIAAVLVSWPFLRPPLELGGAARRLVALSAVVTVAVTPFVAWRIVEDVRFTSRIDPGSAAGAGPVQSFLQPYLLDPVARLLPPGATYHAVAGSGVREEAREAFPALALTSLFPRRSAGAAEADWIVAWGVDPGTVTPVESVTVARPSQAGYPAVLVARVAR